MCTTWSSSCRSSSTLERGFLLRFSFLGFFYFKVVFCWRHRIHDISNLLLPDYNKTRSCSDSQVRLDRKIPEYFSKFSKTFSALSNPSNAGKSQLMMFPILLYQFVFIFSLRLIDVLNDDVIYGLFFFVLKRTLAVFFLCLHLFWHNWFWRSCSTTCSEKRLLVSF